MMIVLLKPWVKAEGGQLPQQNSKTLLIESLRAKLDRRQTRWSYFEVAISQIPVATDSRGQTKVRGNSLVTVAIPSLVQGNKTDGNLANQLPIYAVGPEVTGKGAEVILKKQPVFTHLSSPLETGVTVALADAHRAITQKLTLQYLYLLWGQAKRKSFVAGVSQFVPALMQTGLDKPRANTEFCGELPGAHAINVITLPRGSRIKQPIHNLPPQVYYTIPLEVFARRRREGWDCYGNAIDGQDIATALEVV